MINLSPAPQSPDAGIGYARGSFRGGDPPLGGAPSQSLRKSSGGTRA